MESSTWEQFKALLKKDIVTFARSGPELAAMILFLAVISLVTGYSSNLFAYTVDEKALSVAAATASMIVFMAVFVTGRGFSREAELGILDIMRAQPLDLSIVFAARTVFNAILLVSVSLLSTIVLAFFRSTIILVHPNTSVIYRPRPLSSTNSRSVKCYSGSYRWNIDPIRDDSCVECSSHAIIHIRSHTRLDETCLDIYSGIPGTISTRIGSHRRTTRMTTKIQRICKTEPVTLVNYLYFWAFKNISYLEIQ